MPHTRSAPFRPRLQWSSLLSISTLLASIWLPYVEAQEPQKSAADYYVHTLPGAPEPLLKMYAGHIEITPEHHGHMFFWFFKNRHIADKQRTVIWLNGGPGCSSMDGALMEVGPYRVNEDGTLRYNDGSWDEFANILFIDNPVGTGFSFVDGDSLTHELDEMAAQMVSFLEKWFVIFPAYAHDDLYIAGESYAGQHIPYIATAIMNRNAGRSAHDQWNLGGLLIGNGWISGPEQYLSYIPFGYETGILQSGSRVDQILRDQEKQCIGALDAGGKGHVDMGVCEQIMHKMTRELLEGNQCYNVYDVRLTDSWPACGMNWPPDLKQVTPYLRRGEVTRALNMHPDMKAGWRECDGQVGGAFTARNSKPAVVLLPDLLEKMPIILFSGDKDLICNHIGTEGVIKNLKWNGAVGMEMSTGMTAPKRDWTFEGEPAGQWQTARNLTYIRFYNSSHMVPFNYPRRSRDMLDRFMGVDIDSIGGTPADSRIDGEKGPDTAVGAHPNSAAHQQAEQEKLDAATWAAYRRSGEVALIVVLIAVAIWAYFIWRERRKRKGYRGVFSSDPYDDNGGGEGLGLNADGFRRRERRQQRDIEAAADFDEAELDDLTNGAHHKEMKRERFGLADDEDEGEEDMHHGPGRADGGPS